MQWLTEFLFPGMSWEEIARVSSLGVMTVMLMISVAAVGAASQPRVKPRVIRSMGITVIKS